MTGPQAERVARELTTALTKDVDYTAIWVCRPPESSPYHEVLHCVMIVWPGGGAYWIGLGTEREIAAVIESAYEARGAIA